MALAASAPVGDVINENLFVVARLEADPRVASHASALTGPHAALMTAVAARNTAANAYQKAVALRAAARVRLEALVVPFGLKVAAAYAGREAEEYLRLFPTAPSSLTGLSERELPEAAGQLCARIADAKTAKDLAKAGAPILAATRSYQSASEAAKAADQALAEAQAAVQKAKLACVEAHSKVRGLLTAAFPRQVKLIRSFFPQSKKKAKPADSAPLPPA